MFINTVQSKEKNSFFVCGALVWTQGLHLEPLHQPYFVMCFLEMRCHKLFARALNHDLCFLCSWDYRREPLMPSSLFLCVRLYCGLRHSYPKYWAFLYFDLTVLKDYVDKPPTAWCRTLPVDQIWSGHIFHRIT
jgi:hypothetical protein